MFPPPPTARLTIDLGALAANWRTLARRSGVATGAAIKADGYGLGAVPVLQCLAAAGARDFFVANWAEASALVDVAAGVALHVLHGVSEADIACALALPNAVPILNSPEQAALWRAVAPGRACDVMVDTGINRLGIAPGDLAAAHGLNVDVLLSHLACADDAGAAMNAYQIARFAAIQTPCARRSLAASAGIYLGPDYALDLVRPGLALYGGAPYPAATDLHKVARIEARVLQRKSINPGDPVGYGATWLAARPTVLAILGLGYADGLPRAPGNAALVDGVRVPVVGRVSMDLTTIDITDARAVAVGEWVELAFELPTLAAASGRSQYELLTGLGTRFDRRTLSA